MFGIFKKKNVLELNAPAIGTAVDIKEVPDEVFASGMIGQGIAIQPSQGEIYAPCDGEIINIFPTKHAIGMRTNEGVEILIHIGIDTVEMNGEGFEAFVEEGAKVKKGDKLISFNMELVRNKAKSLITPMLVTNMDVVDNVDRMFGDCDLNSVVLKIKLK